MYGHAGLGRVPRRAPRANWSRHPLQQRQQRLWQPSLSRAFAEHLSSSKMSAVERVEFMDNQKASMMTEAIQRERK